MRSAELVGGRTFVLRLEDGDVLHEAIESFCRDSSVLRAEVTFLGAVDRGSRMVSGPKVPIGDKVDPEVIVLEEPCELVGCGTVFPDEDGSPVAHIHGSVGRKGFSATGDLRAGVTVWLVAEVVVRELVGDGPVRLESDPRLDGKLLEVGRRRPRRSSAGRCTTPTGSRSRSTATSRARSSPRGSSCSSTRSRGTARATPG